MKTIKLFFILLINSYSFRGLKKIILGGVLNLSSLVIPLFSLMIALKLGKLGGWSFESILLLLGIYYFCIGIAMTTYWSSMTNIIYGLDIGWFDYLLIYPNNLLKIVSIVKPYFEALWLILAGLILIIYSLSNLLIPLSGIVILLTGVLLGLLFLFFLVLIFFSIILRNQKFYSLMESVGILASFSRYPDIIFPKIFRIFIISILPIGLISTIPVSIAVNIYNEANLLIISFGSMIVISVFSLCFWKKTVINYQKGQ